MALSDFESLVFLYPRVAHLLTAEDAVAGEYVEWMVRYGSEFYHLLRGAVQELGLYYSIHQSVVSAQCVILRVRRPVQKKAHG